MNESTRYGLNQNKCHHENRPKHLEFTTGKSGVAGTFPDDIGGEDSARRYTPGGDAYDECTNLGKILQRLEQLESAYFEYLGAHKSRLEARLDDNRLSREEFSRQVAELKQEIYKLAIEDQSTNGNGHKD